MSKRISCFICGVLTEVKDERAIGALCPEHKNAQNIEKMKNTPTHQLLRILKDGIAQELAVSKSETAQQIASLRDQITTLEVQLKTQEVYEAPKVVLETKPDGTVNQWGEVV